MSDLTYKHGWIYVLKNKYMPDLYKVGMTTRNVDDRAAELSTATGVPAEFEVVFESPTLDAAALEAICHERLSQYRVNEKREFFACSLDVIKAEIYSNELNIAKQIASNDHVVHIGAILEVRRDELDRAFSKAGCFDLTSDVDSEMVIDAIIEFLFGGDLSQIADFVKEELELREETDRLHREEMAARATFVGPVQNRFYKSANSDEALH